MFPLVVRRRQAQAERHIAQYALGCWPLFAHRSVDSLCQLRRDDCRSLPTETPLTSLDLVPVLATVMVRLRVLSVTPLVLQVVQVVPQRGRLLRVGPETAIVKLRSKTICQNTSKTFRRLIGPRLLVCTYRILCPSAHELKLREVAAARILDDPSP